MVKRALLLLLLAGSVAHARPAPCPDCDDQAPPPPPEYVEEQDDEPGFNMLGFRFSVGALPLASAEMTTLSLGLGVEHPVFRRTRVFAEYEWMWLIARPDERDMATYTSPSPDAPRPDEHASGHRAQLGLRRELVAKKAGRNLRLFVDAELGGGFALINDNMTGVQHVPSAFIGLHAGYDIYTRNDDSPSRTFEAEFLLRAIAVREGIGGLFGIGFAWGN